MYWMTAARRIRSNFALERAVEIAAALHRPLVLLEALRCDYPWASDRLHRFVLEGMAGHAAALAGRPVLYYPYVEPAAGAGRGLIAALGTLACAVVTDWHPGFIFPAMASAAAAQVPVRLEAVDSNGLIPVAAHGRAFPTARGYRAFMQRVLKQHLREFPASDPLAPLGGTTTLDDRGALAGVALTLQDRWPAAAPELLAGESASLAALPIDHSVGPVPTRGGGGAAEAALRAFLDGRLAAYGDDHQHPDLDATSRLSPYLHFGHLSAHDVFTGVMTRERWTTRRLGSGAAGAREGWWGTSPSAEMFLDQLVVWRELAFNGAAWIPGVAEYRTLPAWARQTLEAHRSDARPHLYDLTTLDAAATADPIWNAAQRQLRTEGWFHGYMRMLWGKKILEWTEDPSDALGRMEHLMNRYALDGRDPVSYAGFGWVLGRYDRPWPEREVFGTVRCMTSASARRKLRMTRYLERYGETGSLY